MKNQKHFTMRMLTMVLMTMVGIFSYAGTVILYSLTDNIGSAEVTASDATVNAGTSLVLTNSAGRIKITATNGYKFKNGDVVTFSGTVGNTSKDYGLKIYASDGSTLALTTNVAGTSAATGCTGTLTLSSDQDYIYIGRYAGTTTTMTSFTVTRESSGSNEPTQTLYTVTFNANSNGTCSTSILTEASEGAGVTLPTATANYGYNFLGWSTSSTATTASYNAGATYKPSANITLYAIYEVDANAPVLPAAGSAITFDATKRYSEWVINSRLNDFYGNEKVMNFATYTNDGTKSASGSTTSLDYVPGLVAKAVLETIDYYKDNTEVNVRPWFYAVQDYANNTIPSKGKAGQSFDDLNAVKLYFKLQELAKAGIIPDAADNNISNSNSVTIANTRLSEALAGIKLANSNYSISADLLPDAAGGWWHKSTYTNQMWCDGQYMGPALLAQMLNEYENYESDGYIAGSKEADWDLITKQFTISWNYLWNPDVKLLYHAFTADPECTADTNSKTNAYKWAGFPNSDGLYHSAEYWGRAEGWYFLALVDVLEQMQIAGMTKTQNYATLRSYLNQLAEGIAAKQDATSGCWYQLLNHDGTFVAQSYNSYNYTTSPVANYLESSASAIFTAAYLKGMRLGLYDTDYTAVATKAYQGIVENFMVADGNGGVHLVCCSKSAGVGGSNNRDGSAEYYLMGEDTEPTSKDPNAKDHNDMTLFYTEGKVFGGFILAATEYERRFIDKKLELSENGSYTEFADGDYDEVTLTRSFSSDEWSTLVIPFSVSAEQAKAVFGEGTEIAKADRIENEKLYFSKQNYITANEPVLIKVGVASESGSYTFSNVTVENAANAVQTGNGAQLNGTYTLLTGGQDGDLGAEEYFIYGNKFYDCTYMKQMKPFRAYITTTNAAGAKQLSLAFNDDEQPTTVGAVEAKHDNGIAARYNIAGQNASGTAHGIIIQNGQKTLQ